MSYDGSINLQCVHYAHAYANASIQNYSCNAYKCTSDRNNVLLLISDRLCQKGRKRERFARDCSYSVLKPDNRLMFAYLSGLYPAYGNLFSLGRLYVLLNCQYILSMMKIFLTFFSSTYFEGSRSLGGKPRQLIR